MITHTHNIKDNEEGVLTFSSIVGTVGGSVRQDSLRTTSWTMLSNALDTNTQ